MNKKTMFYGLLAVGAVLVYYAWKQRNLSTKDTPENLTTTTSTSSTTGTFVDDTPVNPSAVGVSTSTAPKSFVADVKGAISSVTEPFKTMQEQ